MKKGIVLGMVILVMGMSFTGTSYSLSINKSQKFSFDGNILYVGGNGTGNYTTIQSAINDAVDGDTVFVYDDSSPYYETVRVYKSINLIGEDKNTTVIDAQKDGTPITITANDIIVLGFKVINMEDWINDSWDFAVIQVLGCNNVIINDNIINAGDEVNNPYVSYGAIDFFRCTNCVISNNYISQNNYNSYSSGVALRYSSNNNITGNNISKYTSGINNLIWYHPSDNNTFSNNHIHHNKLGIDFTIGKYNKILNNKIEYNQVNGIYTGLSARNTITGNIISNNGNNERRDGGIDVASGFYSYNIISDNVIAYNKPTGIYLSLANKDIIARNNFINNYGEGVFPRRWWGNAYFVCFLDKGVFNAYSWENNYWSDLEGNIKIIKGRLLIPILWGSIGIPWFGIDWNPAKEPYDIGV